jgi:dolichol kinase
VSLLRKLIHVATTLVPLLGWLVSYWLALALAALALIASLILEAARRWWPWVNDQLWRWLPSVFRAWEDRRALGSTWFGLGMLAALLLYGRDAGGTAILYLAWGDPAAEVVGRRWGQPGRRKTLAGSLGCLAACLLAGGLGAYLGGLSSWAVVAGALVATLVERSSLPPDDNLWIPALSGLAVLLVQGLIDGPIRLFPDLLNWIGS